MVPFNTIASYLSKKPDKEWSNNNKANEGKKKSMMVTPLRSAILKAGQSSMMEPEA